MKQYRGVIFQSAEPLNNLEDLKKREDLEERGEIKRAFLDEHTKVTIDWVEEQGDFGLVAWSQDGCSFRGKYGTKLMDDGTVELKLVKVDAGGVVLMGYWLNRDQDEGGIAFRLHPAE